MCAVFYPHEHRKLSHAEQVRLLEVRKGGAGLRRRARELRWFASMSHATRRDYLRARFGISPHQVPLFSQPRHPSRHNPGSVSSLDSLLPTLEALEDLSDGDLLGIYETLLSTHSWGHSLIRTKTRVRQAVYLPIIAIPPASDRERGIKVNCDSDLLFSYEHPHGLRWENEDLEKKEELSLFQPTTHAPHLFSLLEAIFARATEIGNRHRDKTLIDHPLRAIFESEIDTKLLNDFVTHQKDLEDLTYLEWPHTHQTLNALRVRDRELFYELMVRLAVMLHKVADHLWMSRGDCRYRSSVTYGKHERRYLVYVWPWFLERLKIFDKLEAYHINYLSAFHPWHSEHAAVQRDEKLRTLLTSDEVHYLCSIIDVTPASKPTAYNVREVDSVSHRITTVKKFKDPPFPKRGYFHSRLTPKPSEEFGLGNYVQWLFRTYNPDLTLKTGKVFTPSTLEDTARPEALLRFKEVASLPRYDYFVGGRVLDFKSWLESNNGKPFEQQQWTPEEFVQMHEQDPGTAMELVEAFFGYCLSQGIV